MLIRIPIIQLDTDSAPLLLLNPDSVNVTEHIFQLFIIGTFHLA